MNAATRKTRACRIDALDGDLKGAIRAHGKQFGLEDLEADVLICCETLTVHQKKGIRGGIRATLSAVYVTPKWLVWAESSGPDDVSAGAALLSQIDARDDRSTARYAIRPDQGLHITGRYRDEELPGITFILLGADADGRKFRHVLGEALRNAAK